MLLLDSKEEGGERRTNGLPSCEGLARSSFRFCQRASLTSFVDSTSEARVHSTVEDR